MVHGRDPYYPAYFEGRSDHDSFIEYFRSIPENISAFDNFDVYGHLDYVVRYAPEQNAHYSYLDYMDLIDEILTALISRGKGIEINTAGFKYGLGHPNPTEGIIKRYRELGGEIITVGADAHVPDAVGYDFEKLSGILSDAGFKYFTVFEKRKPTFIKIE
jgi:histidinol-phosphatase (PHP family)